MAEYGARESEFRRIYEEQLASDRKRFESDASALSSAESVYSRFERSYKEYMDWRDRKLNDSLSILRNTSSAESMQSEWRSYFESAAGEASDRISRECRDDKAPGLRSVADSLASSESSFFRKMGSFNFASFCGLARWALKSFREKRDELRTEWTTVKSNDNSIDEKARATAEQIRTLYETTINDLVSKKANIQNMKQKAEDWARDLVKGTSGAPEGIDTALPSQVWQMAEYYLNLMAQLRSKNSDLVRRLEEAFEQEDRTVIRFVETRNRTRSFVSNTNLGLVEKEFNNRRDSCARFADEVSTSGQRDDARRFMQKVTDEARKPFDEFKSEYNQFVKEFEGIFLDPLTESTINELIEEDYWKNSQSNLESFNIERKLKDIYNDYSSVVPVNLSGLTDQQKQVLVDSWKKEMDRIGKAIIDDQSFWQRTKSVIALHIPNIRGKIK